MPHLCPDALTFTSANAANAFQLYRSNIGTYQNLIRADSEEYVYQAVVTLGSAVQLFQRHSFFWSAVMCYYSAFYSARSMLAANNYCLFYVGGTPFRIRIENGQSPIRTKGRTHEAILSYFSEIFSGKPILGNSIEEIEPWKWLQKRRNECNYLIGGTTDPVVPDFFHRIYNNGLRISLDNYVEDVVYSYTFDKDHSIFSYPIGLLRDTLNEMKQRDIILNLDKEREKLVSDLFRDKFGILRTLYGLVV